MKRLPIALLLALLATVQLYLLVPAVSVQADNPCPDIYTVKYGDTLSQIAEKCATTMATLRDANPAIRDTNRIYIGQKLVIRVDLSTPTPLTGGGTTYIVQAGDTLGGIAYRYHTTVRELMQLNADIDKAWLIYEDQVLVLPEGSNPPSISLSTRSVTEGSATQIAIQVSGFPGYAAIDYRVGKQGQAASFIIDSKTSVNGDDSLTITTPSSAKAGETWVIQVITTDRPDVTDITSPTISIEKQDTSSSDTSS